MLHTSGTTARPKVVPLTHEQIMARSGALPIGPADRCLCITPLFTGSALNHSLVAPLAAGAAVLFPEGAGADAILDAVGALEATYFSASPTVPLALADALGRRGSPKYRSLRFVRSSSSAPTPAAQERIEAAFGLPVLQGYGMTDVGTIAQDPLPPLPHKRGSVGLSAGPEIAILDDAGIRARSTRSRKACLNSRFSPPPLQKRRPGPSPGGETISTEWARTG